MDIYEVLNELNIDYEEICHEAIYTVEDAKKLEMTLDGVGCKNIFLKGKKAFYLVVLHELKRANLKGIEKITEEKHLHFASEDDLMKLLGLVKGSVTPLGIINDVDNKVSIIIDSELEKHRLLVHPNINTKTISIDFTDLIKFIESMGHKYQIISL